MEKIRKDLETYNETEQFYREYYYAKRSPETLSSFLAQHTAEEVRKNQWLCPELYEFGPDILSSLKESQFFQIKNARNIWVEKHNRYSPAFEHAHEYFEIFYVLSGKCIHTISMKEETLREGTLCFVSPYVNHRLAVFDDSIVLNIMIQKSTFDNIFYNDLRADNILTDFFLTNLYSNPLFAYLQFTFHDEELEDMLLGMLEEESIEDNYTFRILSHRMSIFLAILIRKYSKTAVYRRAFESGSGNILQIIRYISDNYRSVNLTDVAGHFHYTLSHCSRLIKDQTGQNFTDLLREIRLRRAQSMLLSSSMNIDEISYLVGYENTDTFIRAFKKVYGITPGRFRQINSIQEPPVRF